MTKLPERDYIKEFKVQNADYNSAIEEKHRHVFQLPDDPTRWSPDWTLFPGPIFQPHIRALFDHSRILGFRAGFEDFRQFLVEAGESDFICFLLPSQSDPARIYQFPTSIDWDTYASGGPSSMVHLHGGQANHVFGDSGGWGAYYIEPWLSWVWGFHTEETLNAFRKVFEKEEDTKTLAEECLNELPQTKHWRSEYENFVDRYMSLPNP